MKDYIEELLAQIDAMSLAPSASSALLEATLDVFHRMKQEEVMQAVPLSHRIATAAFLACDSKACIAISKLKRAFGDNISGKNITKARRALQIPHVESPMTLTQNEIHLLTGCTEITQRKLIKTLLLKLAPKMREK
jgi:hypothetical protein